MPSKLPRVNVTVTEEQHSLLLELAQLQGGSAAGFLRQMLDASTPLLRVSVPMLRAAAEEMELTRAEAAKMLEAPLRELKSLGMLGQADLLDVPPVAAASRRAPRSERSERASTEKSGSAPDA